MSGSLHKDKRKNKNSPKLFIVKALNHLATVEAFITHVGEKSLGKYTRTPKRCVPKILVAQSNGSSGASMQKDKHRMTSKV